MTTGEHYAIRTLHQRTDQQEQAQTASFPRVYCQECPGGPVLNVEEMFFATLSLTSLQHMPIAVYRNKEIEALRCALIKSTVHEKVLKNLGKEKLHF